MINPLGNDAASIRSNLLAGSTDGVRLWERTLRDKAVFVGAVDADLPELPAGMAKLDCRNNRLLLAALTQIEDSVDYLMSRYDPERIGIVLGTSTSGIREGEEALDYRRSHGKFPAQFHYRQQEIGTPALFLRQYLGVRGLAMTVSTACSSSAKVFASASRLIDADLCDAVIIGGADSLCRLTVEGFSALESVSSGRCNPMSVNRDGINIGEAAALFVVSREEAQVRLLGCGESSDAHHMSAPHPQGRGAIASMQAALASAGLRPDQIAYINLHGTATPKNDAMESIAVASLFPATPCSSTKPMTGHTLGAAGATEIGFCYLLLSGEQTTLLPPHLWDGQLDPAIPRLNLVNGESLRLGSGTAMLSNSFAFGGNNASVILARS